MPRQGIRAPDIEDGSPCQRDSMGAQSPTSSPSNVFGYILAKHSQNQLEVLDPPQGRQTSCGGLPSGCVLRAEKVPDLIMRGGNTEVGNRLACRSHNERRRIPKHLDQIVGGRSSFSMIPDRFSGAPSYRPIVRAGQLGKSKHRLVVRLVPQGYPFTGQWRAGLDQAAN